MASEEQASQAQALESAKRDLETRIARTISNYEQEEKGEPLEVRLTLGGESSAPAAAPADLVAAVHEHVEAFHEAEAVQAASVRVRQLTAIDSDADGEVAVNVKYDYPGR